LDERTLRKVVMDIVGRDAVADDCAIFPSGKGFMVASTDMVHASTDFPEGMSDWEAGWMSVAVTLSDIAAMGATPSAILLAVGLDDPSRLRPILEGAKVCFDNYGTRFAGGDLDFHRELTIVSSGWGYSDAPVRRSGARVGDLVGIIGIPGRAQAALEGHLEYRDFLFTPKPRITEGHMLAKAGVTSMMDVSDGLLMSLHDMLEVNNCGYELFSSRIPTINGLSQEESLKYALNGGGDFGILFTSPPEILPLPLPDLYIIGTVIGEKVVNVDGEVASIQGYQHHWD